MVIGPSRPLLSLVGAISGEDGGIALLIDATTKSVFRLKTGESHSGWTLLVVGRREVTFQKGSESLILTIPSPPAR
jgi:general secretion pathway protein N